MKPIQARNARGPAARDDTQDRAANEDPYLVTHKPVEPTTCPKCHAVFEAGRWKWGEKRDDALLQLCPACQRIEDKFPAGYVMIKGQFIKDHRDDIVNTVTAQEERAKAGSPLQRIMAIEDVREGLQVTTTDSQLAREIGEALHDAYKGDLKLKYSRDENLLRATWKRDK